MTYHIIPLHNISNDLTDRKDITEIIEVFNNTTAHSLNLKQQQDVEDELQLLKKLRKKGITKLNFIISSIIFSYTYLFILSCFDLFQFITLYLSPSCIFLFFILLQIHQPLFQSNLLHYLTHQKKQRVKINLLLEE